MNLKNLKDKVVRNLPEILGVTFVVALVTTAVVIIVKTPKMSSITTRLNGFDSIDLSSLDQINALKEMIENATAASIIPVTEGAIIFLER